MDLYKYLLLFEDVADNELAKQIFNYTKQLFENNQLNTINQQALYQFLNTTSKPKFLKLFSEQERYLWAEIVFKILQLTNFSLLDLFLQRVDEHPNKVLFQENTTSDYPIRWTYAQVKRQLEELAALFMKQWQEPRLAIYSANSAYSAMTDLAALFYHIFVTPLNIHFRKDILVKIFKQLDINIVVTDTEARLETLKQVREELNRQIIIFTTFPVQEKDNVFYLQKQAKQLKSKEIEELLLNRKQIKLSQVVTTMFTSGSTGEPKGVSFSHYNLISKRFARGAALPFLGEDEVMLCYLPLFHTFGRYLELLGSIYWRGTYVFVGNNSAETLLKLFPQVEPTIFISIPLRWINLYEKILEGSDKLTHPELIKSRVRQIMGNRFKWGLSAAGYLSPQIFKFFQNNGINLCSGFGMTEATGGITMTPPGEYKDESVGKPLPGIKTRLKSNGELEISGHYLARYLSEKGPWDEIPYPTGDDNKDYWLSTGDVFKIDEDGHHYIVDRVKDIYKNTKGQTIAPRVIEAKFKGVPGIKQVFLVGDARPYNVLLIVPDFKDTILQSTPDIEEYFRQIINAANSVVAPYERVVNFAILDREFSLERGELTPKGSYNRKTIEKNFKDVIERLYQSEHIELSNSEVKVIIPRWFVRDLGILETDLELTEDGLLNKHTGQFLYIKHFKKNCYFVGDLIYRLDSNVIDLGILARQPKLWLGNPQVIKFCPLREGWDIPINGFSERVRVQGDYQVIYLDDQIPRIKDARSPLINRVNWWIIKALFSEEKEAIEAIEELGKMLKNIEKNLGHVIRLRLQALAYSPYESIRTTAYRILLLDEPNPDYNKVFPEFLLSGKTYLNEESIKKIAQGNIGKHQLQALRERLYAYRTKLKWDLNEIRRMHFEYIFKLLHDFTLKNFEYFPSVRAELASWALHKDSPKLAKAAKKYLQSLEKHFNQYIEQKFKNVKPNWDKLLVFGADISDTEKKRLLDIFEKTHFLEKSIIVAFNEPNFSIEKVVERGIWIVKMLTIREFIHYRIGINTKDAAHYDLHMVISIKPNIKVREETPLWMAAISGFPFGWRVLPALGCNMPEKGVLSTEYVIGLTVWDKIMEYTDIHKAANFAIRQKHWKKLFVRAFSAFFKAWKYSGYKIVPGVISPHNVSVPELDFRQNTMIITLTNWKYYQKPLDLVEPMINEFYLVVNALYPWTEKMLNIDWIFDAVVEALGQKEAQVFLEKLYKDLKNSQLQYHDKPIYQYVAQYLDKLKTEFHFPLALELAIDRYKEWCLINPNATTRAKLQTIQELIELYKLDKYPPIVRYKFYAETYFAKASDKVRKQFDLLLSKMSKDPNVHPLQLIELSDLQSVLETDEDIEVFTKMVFPHISKPRKVEFEKLHTKVKDALVLKSELKDKYGMKYTFREPIHPSEIGQLYQLFYKENYPKEISEHDKHLVLLDQYGRVIGGLSYRELEDNIVLLDGLVVTSALQGRGLGTAMINDFFDRMAAKGVKVIKAHFLFGNYYLKHNFKVDEKWGALVRYLDT